MLQANTSYVYAIVAAVLFGASTPAAKWLLNESSPWVFAGLLYLGSGLGLLLARLIGRAFRSSRTVLPHGRDWLWLGGSTVFGGVLGPVLLMTGLTRTDAASASLLLTLEGVFTALLAWFVFRENFDRRIFIGMAAILAGSVLLSWSGVPGYQGFIGPICVAGACFSWGIDNNFTKQVSAGDALFIAMTKGLAAGITNTVLALSLGHTLPPLPTLLGAGVVGFLGYGISLLCFVLALRHIGAARTGAYFSLAPFVGALIAISIGGERLSWRIIGAALVMGLGIWLHLTERHEHEHVHEELEHEHEHVHDKHHQHAHGSDVPSGEPHVHRHRHARLIHSHPHYPDIHHRHGH